MITRILKSTMILIMDIPLVRRAKCNYIRDVFQPLQSGEFIRPKLGHGRLAHVIGILIILAMVN